MSDYGQRPQAGLYLCTMTDKGLRTPRVWAEDRDVRAARLRARERLDQYIVLRRRFGESPMPDDFTEQVYFLPDP